jgi:hypothetical protein
MPMISQDTDCLPPDHECTETAVTTSNSIADIDKGTHALSI